MCGFPPQARTIIIRAADKYVLRILQIHTKAVKALESIELYWPDSEVMPCAQDMHRYDLLRSAGVSVVLKWHGETHKIA